MTFPDFFQMLIWLLVVSATLYWFYRSYKSTSEEPENHYELGLRFILENKKRKAIEYLKEAIRKDSNNVDAYVKLGNILREEGAVTNALRVHKDLMLRTEMQKDDRYNVLKSLSEDLIQLKQDDKALPFLEQLQNGWHNDEFSLRELVRIYENLSRFDDAFKLLKKANDTAIHDKDVRMAMYLVIKGLNNVEKDLEKDARITYKDALKYHPKCEAAYVLIGDSYWREDRKEDAIEKWLECANRIPEKAHFVFERLEKGWFETGEFYKLEDFYNSLLSKKPFNSKALIALANFKSKKGEVHEAIKLLEEYSDFKQDEKSVLAHKILLQEKAGKFNESLELARQYFSNYALKNEDDYICQSCGNTEDEPLGKCPSCGQWGKYL